MLRPPEPGDLGWIVERHARPIYEAARFELVRAEPHRMFGPEVVGQNRRLALS